MKKCLRVLLRVIIWLFVLLFLYVGSLFFRTTSLPERLSNAILNAYAPSNIVIQCREIRFGFRDGLSLHDLKIYDQTRMNALESVASAETIRIDPLNRLVRAKRIRYARLPDSYYEPGNQEVNRRVEASFPPIAEFRLILDEPDILSVRPESVFGYVDVSTNRIDFKNLHLRWPGEDRALFVDGFCTVDLGAQVVTGMVHGLARQCHIRPMLVALDVPVSLPYFDGFTEVTQPVPSQCDWNVNLVNNDFDLWLDLKPDLGRYNTVPMRHADGLIHLHNQIRDTFLNYHQEVVVTNATDTIGRTLGGRVDIYGLNGTNTVEVRAASGLPVAALLKIGGFTGDYVGENVFGHSRCDLLFNFPRAMSNNYEVLNGRGHVEIRDGQVMRMKGFAGLIQAMPSIAPGVAWLSDSTQASCDYVITNGVLKSDNIYIDSYLYSIKMYGSFDAVANRLDFTTRVQFAKSDTLFGKILHPLTWPFTKLILEFHLGGTPEAPEWRYISIIDRVLEILP